MTIGAIGAVGGVGAGASIGGGMSAGAVGAPAAGAPAAAAGAQLGGGDTGTQVTISSAAQKAMATDNQQVGASFSVTTDAAGHHYAGNVDANGFSMQVSINTNTGNQGYEDLVAAVLLALLLKEKQ